MLWGKGVCCGARVTVSTASTAWHAASTLHSAAASELREALVSPPTPLKLRMMQIVGVGEFDCRSSILLFIAALTR